MFNWLKVLQVRLQAPEYEFVPGLGSMRYITVFVPRTSEDSNEELSSYRAHVMLFHPGKNLGNEGIPECVILWGETVNLSESLQNAV